MRHPARPFETPISELEKARGPVGWYDSKPPLPHQNPHMINYELRASPINLRLSPSTNGGEA